MVCQAAAQTRFRALKHESGIAGSSTIIVRIIACFQPLQDCQAEYFRHLLKPVTCFLCGVSLMKKYPDPWVNMPYSTWQFSSFNTAADLQKPDFTRQNAPVWAFPNYISPFGCSSSSRNAATPFPRIPARISAETMSALNPPAIPTFGTPEFAGSHKRFMGFSQSWDQTSLIFSSSCNPYLTLNPTNQSLDLQGSNEVVSVGHGGEEMHEDTDEINALLYSDSDDEDYEEEEASTGHSPIEPKAGSSSEVASSVLPVKRKRIDADETDALLADTASSHHHDLGLEFRNRNTNTDGESSCVRGEDQDQDRKRMRREKILETVRVLRRIIPCGKGKDAATVLDEAICYLKSLKLKAKALGATPLLELRSLDQ
ncbi:hypothetical protein OPV22_023134 [Ensete ventricosum]|uniref:BHLH domain-containing protein n=1 Tax=Ensete ventricosum TaxID=4639 RepID=A0AAV8QUN1_ENSVE|nr:hypothetical protein OPV22_023134 [Ensete ventricosum]